MKGAVPRLSIMLVGDAGRTEFRDARICLDRWGVVHGFSEIAAAAAALAEAEVVPDVIVVAQAFPGQFSHQAIEQLRRLAPLARVGGLMGSWCEGEMRTGSPWPGVVRTYWHQWTARCNRELRRLARGQCCSWALPPTATEEERLLTNTAEPRPRQDGVVVICAWSHEAADWLSAACRRRGFATIWQRTPTTARARGATAIIFDGGSFDEVEYQQLQHLAATVRPTPVLALLAFPRLEDQRRALSAGAAAVLSKPLAVDDLCGELDRVSRQE
jgi:DNA-binding NarL/FixJ family response regulator